MASDFPKLPDVPIVTKPYADELERLSAGRPVVKVNLPNPNVEVPTQSRLQELARKVGRCGEANSGWVCTKPANHESGRHEAKQVGGPEDGRTMHWWKDRK